MNDDSPDSMSRRQFIQVTSVTVAASALPVAAAAPAVGPSTAARYILTRLKQQGADVLFGVPGATCDPLYAAASAPGSPVSVVVNSSDLEAGYAADGYARIRGLGAVAVTAGVGTMGLLSVIGGAFAERSPVVIINGGPTEEDLRLQKELGTLFSHSIGREGTDLAMFRQVTEFAERVERAADVPRVVDAAIKTAVMRQRPVYLEIPKNLWEAKCPAPTELLDVQPVPTGEEEATAKEIVSRLSAAKSPVLLLGIELQRSGLAKEISALVSKWKVPWATTLLAKAAVIPEQAAGFVGVYAGEHSLPEVKASIEKADLVLCLGCVMGRQYRSLMKRPAQSLIVVANDKARLGGRAASKVTLKPLLAALETQAWSGQPRFIQVEQRPSPRAAETGNGLGYDETMHAISDVLDDSFITLTDTSLSMYPAAQLKVVGTQSFVCNAVWQAIGFSVGAAVGVGLAQTRRPLVICGDGGFQMSAQSLSTMARRKLRSIVLVLDNGHYGIEQWLLDPSYFSNPGATVKPYLQLNRWRYADFAKSLGFTAASTVASPAELVAALAEAKKAEGPVLIAVTLNPKDLPAELRA